MTKNVIKRFVQIYGEGSVRKFFSPGRINLIGEHIDYNGGFVFPCALDFGIYGIVRIREDKLINLVSTNFSEKVTVNIDEVNYNKFDGWANYPKGVIKIMNDMGYKVGGMDILISGNIPNRAGLSSSASLEMLIAVMINNLFNNQKIDRIELVKIAQKCENDFVGVKCGIMDQFAVGMGKNNKAILLQCNNLEYKYANLELGDYSLVIMNTNKIRALNESKYNERRAECEEALNIVRKKKYVQNLCNLTPSEFNNLQFCIDNEVIRKRAIHCINENERVKLAYKYLNMGDIKKFGELLIESHQSLRDLYEVTGKELDFIVESALKQSSCIGARMTGAGFGGCAIAIVKTDKISSFTDRVGKIYKEGIGHKADFYMSNIGRGTYEIQ